MTKLFAGAAAAILFAGVAFAGEATTETEIVEAEAVEVEATVEAEVGPAVAEGEEGVTEEAAAE